MGVLRVHTYDTAYERWVGSSAEEQSAFNRLVVGSSPTQPNAVWRNAPKGAGAMHLEVQA